jgi:cysteine desulfuration protein SufE
MLETLTHDPRAAQGEIIASFRLFPEWLDRYQYLIDLGKQLPPLAAHEKPTTSCWPAASHGCGCTSRATPDGSPSAPIATPPSCPA